MLRFNTYCITFTITIGTCPEESQRSNFSNDDATDFKEAKLRGLPGMFADRAGIWIKGRL
jgi:hypothetical protein